MVRLAKAIGSKHLRQMSSLILILGISHFAFSTAIFVIKTADGFWVGADSLRGIGDGKQEQVCKIHETPIGLIGKTSAVQGFTATGEDYSIDKEIEGAVNSSSSARKFEEELRQRFEDDIWGQMIYLLHNPRIRTKDRVETTLFNGPMPGATREYEFRNVILISVEGNNLKLRQLMVSPSSRRASISEYHYFVDVLNWIEIDEKMVRDPRDLKHPSLHQIGEWVSYDKDDGWITQHPRIALRQLLQLSREQDRTSVGPPYAIVHLTLSATTPKSIRFHWMEKGVCPSWTYTIHSNDESKMTNGQ